MAFAETANLLVKLSLGGNFKSQLSKATSDLKRFEKDSTRAYKAGAQIGTGIKRGAILAAGGFALLATAVGKSVDVAGDFEAQLNTINTIARTSPQLLGKIGDSIRQVAKDTGTSLDDLTQGYYDLLSAGIKTADAQNVLIASNKLAIGGISTTAEAIDLLTTAINTYGGDASQAAKDSDIFAKAVERGKVTASEIAGSFATVGPLAAAYKIEIGEIGAAYARLTSAGVPAAEAATQMRAAIQALVKPDKGLKALEAQTNKNYLSIAGKKGLVIALQQMRTDAEKAHIPLGTLTSRIEGMQFILQTTGPNFKSYQADLKAMGDATGTAAEQMAERQKGLNPQLAKLRANIKDAGITIGTALLPKITPVVAALNKFINDNQTGIAAFGDQLAGAFTPEGIISGLKGITDALIPLVDLVKVAAAPVKAITQAFLSLPKEVQTVLIGAFAVNKLTGGLVTNAAGGIIEAIGKGLLGGIKAPLVNVTGGVVTVEGGVPGVGGLPGGGGGGLLASVGGTTGLAALVGAAVIPLIPLVATYALAGGESGIAQKDLAGRQATAAARGLNPANVPTRTAPGMQSPLSIIKVKDDRTYDAIERQRAAIGRFGEQTRAASRATVAALHDRDSSPIVNTSTTTNVKVNVTAGGVKKVVDVASRYGTVGGSRVVNGTPFSGGFGGH